MFDSATSRSRATAQTRSVRSSASHKTPLSASSSARKGSSSISSSALRGSSSKPIGAGAEDAAASSRTKVRITMPTSPTSLIHTL